MAKTTKKDDVTENATRDSGLSAGMPINKLKELSQATKAPKDEVLKTYKDAIKEWKAKAPTADADTIGQRALRTTILRIRSKYRGMQVTAFIFSLSGVIDYDSGRISEAKRLFQHNKRLAVSKGLTDSNGNPIDNKPTRADGKPNRDFGKPLISRPFRRGLCMARWEKDGKEQRAVCQFYINGDIDPPPVSSLVRFSADRIDVASNPAKVMLSKEPNFTLEEKQPDPQAFYEDHFPGGITKFESLAERVIQDTQAKERTSYLIEADVQEMDMTPNRSTGSRSMFITDSYMMDELPMRVFVPPHINIDFGVESRILAVVDGRYKEQYGVSLEMVGCYAIPGYRTEPMTTPDLKTDDEGWGVVEEEDVAAVEEVTQPVPAKTPKKAQKAPKKAQKAPEDTEEGEEVEEDAQESHDEPKGSNDW